MAQTKVTSELLRTFAKLLQDECGRFRQIKSSMDENLSGFLWDDPVAHKFKAQYEDRLKPLNEKLYPAMEQYENYLIDEVRMVENVNDDSGSNLGTFAAAAGAATAVTAGAAVGAAPKKHREKRKDQLSPEIKDDKTVGSGSPSPHTVEVDKDGNVKVTFPPEQQKGNTEVINEVPETRTEVPKEVPERKVVPRPEVNKVDPEVNKVESEVNKVEPEVRGVVPRPGRVPVNTRPANSRTVNPRTVNPRTVNPRTVVR